MLESLVPLGFALQLTTDPDEMDAALMDGRQLIELTVEAPFDLDVSLEGKVRDVAVRSCDGTAEGMRVRRFVDFKGSVGIVLDPAVRVCGVMIRWSAPLELVASDTSGAGVYDVAVRRTAIRPTGPDSARGSITGWALMDGDDVGLTEVRVNARIHAPKVLEEEEGDLGGGVVTF